MPFPFESMEAVATVVRGVSFDKSEVGSEPKHGTVPILRAGNISDVLDTGADLIWVPSARVKTEQLLRSGDIAICMSSGSQSVVGKSAPLRGNWNGSVGAFCSIVRPRSERIEPEFLALYMRSEGFRTWTRKSEGVNIKNIRHSELLKHRVPVPTLLEQRRIVDLLSRAENIVRMRRGAEAKAKEIIPALFLDMFGDPARNERGWEVATLKDLSVRGPEYGANAKSGGELSGGPRYVRITDIDGDGELRPGDKVGIAEGDWSEYELAEGDIVIARSGNTVGKSLLYRADYGPCVFAGYLIRFRPNRERVKPEYLEVALRTEYFRTWVASHRRAAGQPNINGQEYAGLVLPVPRQDLQVQFARQVQDIRAMAGSQRGAVNIAVQAFESLLAGVFGENM